MTIQYDHKMRGLLVDVTEDDVRAMAEDVCTKAGQTDLLQNSIHHVTYIPAAPDEVKAKRALGRLVLVLLLWLVLLVVMLSGLYQIGSWIIAWVFS